MQEALAAAAAQYQPTGEEDVYPPGAHAIGHGGVHGEAGEGPDGDASQMAKRTADWVQEGEEEQDEAKKARLDGEPGLVFSFVLTKNSTATCLLGIHVMARQQGTSVISTLCLHILNIFAMTLTVDPNSPISGTEHWP